MYQIKQSEATAARRRIPVLFVSSTDGFTPVTPTSPAAYISANGATWVAATNAVAVATLAAGQSAAGVYYLELTAAELANLGWITVNIQATNARQYNAHIQVMAYDPYDVVRIGLTSIPNVAQGTTGSLPTGNATGQVTVATNNDKTGYSLTQAFPTNFSSLAITVGGAVTAGTVSDKTGYSLSATQTYNNSGSVGSVTGAVGSVTGAVGSVTGNVSGNVTGSIGSLTATAVQNIWDDLTSNNTTVGSVGKLLVDNLNAPVGNNTPALMWANATRTLSAGTNIVLAKGTGITGFNDIAATDVWASATRTLSSGANIVLAKGTGITGFNDITANTIWSEALPGTYTSGQAGFKLNAAGSAADPWATSIPGAYSAGSAGFIIGNNLNATVSSRMATFTLPTNFSSLAISGTGAVTAGTVSDKTGYSLSGSQTFSTTGSVGSVTSGVTVTTNNDKTGYSLVTAPPTAATIATTVWSENISSYNTNNTAGKVLKDLNALNPGITGNTTNNITATTTTFSVDRNDSDNTFNHQTIVFTSGLLNGVSSDIITWTKVGSYAVVTVGDPLPSAPSNNTPFYILPQHVQSIDDIVSGVWNEVRSTSSPSGGTPAAGTYGYYLDSRVSTAGGGGGGGYSVTVRQGPFALKSEQDTIDGVVEALVGATLPLQIQVTDGDGVPVPISGTATIALKSYNSAGTLVETTTGTLDMAALGYISASFTTTTTATAGRYTVVAEVTDSTVIKYGGLQLLVKAL